MRTIVITGASDGIGAAAAQILAGRTATASSRTSCSPGAWFHDRGLSSVAFHPGVVATGFAADTTSPLRWMYHGLLRQFLTPPEQGGATLASFIASEPGIAWQSGQY